MRGLELKKANLEKDTRTIRGFTMNCKCGEDMTIEEENAESGTLLSRVWACEGCGTIAKATYRVMPEPIEVEWQVK